MRLLTLVTAALLLTFGAIACGDDDEDVDDSTGESATATTASATSGDSAGGDTVELVAADFQFGPEVLAVDAPGPVQIHFTNTGEAKHNFMVDELDVSQDIDPNGDIVFDFDVPDHDVEFHCHFHPDTMKGTIRVGGGTGGGASPKGDASPSATDAGGNGGGYSMY